MKNMKKVLVYLLAMIMLFAFGITANAATTTSVAAIKSKSLTVTQKDAKGKDKSVNSVTLYTNGSEETNDANKAITVTYTYDDVTVTVDGEITKETVAPVGVQITSNKRGVANVNADLEDVSVKKYGKAKVKKTVNRKTKVETITTTQTYKVTGSLIVDPVANGSAKITITENTSNKSKQSKAITVNVKTYVDEINFGSNVQRVPFTTEEGEADTKQVITVAETGKLNLGAAAQSSASDKKLKYQVTQIEMLDGTWLNCEQSSLWNSIIASKYVSIDSKGNVSIKKNGAFKEALVKVSSNDKHHETYVNVETVKATDLAVTSVKLVQDTNSTKAVLGMMNKKNTLTMKANKTSSYATYQLAFMMNKGAKNTDLVFASNKPAVATVDANGKITAKGNGSAKITITTKEGNTVKGMPSVSVNVSTDVEMVTATASKTEILANNKDTAKVVATTNSNASNKKVAYSVLSVADADNKIVDAKDYKNYIDVTNAKKGTIKAKKACKVTLIANAQADKTKTATVTVKAVVPVNSVEIWSAKVDGEEVKAYGKKNNQVKLSSVTAFRTDVYAYQELELVPTVKGANGATPNNTDVIVTSSNNAVVDCYCDGSCHGDCVDEDGNIHLIPLKNGTSTITVAAADGSGKKATIKVTVKTDAYEINVAKANDGDTVYVEAKKDKKGAFVATNYDLKSVIAAKTNTDASNKNVDYYLVEGETETLLKAVSGKINVKLNADETASIRIKTKDTRKDNRKEELGAVTKDITVSCINPDYVARTYTVDIWDEEIALNVGDEYFLSHSVSTEEDKAATLDLNAVTYKSSDAKSVAVDATGKITAKATGKRAVITASFAYTNAAGKKATATDSVVVYTGSKYADVAKNINTQITKTLKAEDYSYTGAVTTFNTKYNDFVVDIQNPGKDLSAMKNAGLVAAIENAGKTASTSYRYDYNTLNVYNMVTDEEWHIEKHGTSVDVYTWDEENWTEVQIGADLAFADAVQLIFDNNSDGSTLGSLAGQDYAFGLNLTETRDFKWNEKVDGKTVAKSTSKTFDYNVWYYAYMIMDTDLFAEQVDAGIAEAMAMTVPGVKEMKYDASENTIDILVNNAAQNIAEADAAVRESVVVELNNVFGAATKVSMTSILGDGKQDKIEKERREGNREVDELINEYLEKLANRDITTFGQLDGSKILLDVDFEIGSQRYSQEYKVNVMLDPSAFDATADSAISAAAEEAYDFGDVTYAADSNTISIIFNDAFRGKNQVDLAGTGLATMLNTLIDQAGVDKETDITIVRSDATEAKSMKVNNSTEIFAALVGGGTTLQDLNDRTATITVPYKSSVNGGTTTVLEYNVEFKLDETALANAKEDIKKSLDAAADVVISTTVSENDIVIGTAAYASDKNELTLTIKDEEADELVTTLLNSKNATNKALTKILNAMFKTAELDKNDSVVVNGTTVAVTPANVLAAMVDGAETIRDITDGDNVVEIVVPYTYFVGNEAVTVDFTYTVVLTTSVPAVSEEVVTEEMTTEEATEEIAEEVTSEEATDESVEETTEEATEETTEEVATEEATEETTEEVTSEETTDESAEEATTEAVSEEVTETAETTATEEIVSE